MASVATLSIAVNANSRGLRRGLGRAQKSVRGFANSTKFGSRALAGMTAGLQRLNMALKLTTAAATAAITALTIKGFREGDKLAKTADKLGIAVEKLAGGQLGAARAGVTGFDTALQRMVRRTAEAAQGTGEARGAIKELGLDARRLATQSPDEQLRAIADAMQGVGSQNDRIRLAFKLFDTEGVGMVNLLRNGSKGLDDFEKRAKRLGLTISRVDAAKLEMANDAIADLRDSFVGLFRQFAVGIAPTIQALAEKLTDIVVNFTDGKTSAERFVGAIRSVAVGAAKAMDFVESVSLQVGVAIGKVTSQLVFEVQTAIAALKPLDSLISKVFGVSVGKAGRELQDIIDTIDSGTKKFETRLSDIQLNPRAGSVNAFFDDVEKRAKENAEAIAKAAEGGGMGIGDDIEGGFKRGLEAIRAGSTEELSTIVGGLQGGVQSNAARETAERGGREFIAAMGGKPGVVEPADLGEASRRAAAAGGVDLALQNTGTEGRSLLETLIQKVEEQTRVIERQPAVAPAGLD